MERSYSSLRRTRKRAHSSKCPCCYSSEEEQETHASAKKEKIKDGNQSKGKGPSTRKRKLASDVDVNNSKDVREGAVSPAESVDENQNSQKRSEKPKKNGTKRKTASSKQQSTNSALNDEEPEENNKQRSKVAKAASKKKSRTGVSTPSKKDKSLEGKNFNQNKDGLKKMASTQIQSKSKKVNKRNAKQELKNGVGVVDKDEIELKETALNSKKKNDEPKTLKSSRNNGTQKQSNREDEINGVVERGRLSDVKKPSAKVKKVENYIHIKTRGKTGKASKVLTGSSSELSKEKEIIPVENNKHPKAFSSGGSLAKLKIEAFDHLFCELKRCPGFSKLTVSSAADFLLKLTADKLKSLLPGPSPKHSKIGTDKQPGNNLPLTSAKAKTTSTSSEPKRRRTESEKSSSQSSESNSVSCLASPGKVTSGKAEEAKLSQAAEALVSFRANPTILRQEKSEANIPLAQSHDKDNANSNMEKVSEASQSSSSKAICTPVVEAQIVSTTNEVGGQLPQAFDSWYVNAPSQSHVVSQLQSSFLTQGALHVPVRFPASIEANLQHVTTMQQNLMNLSQITSQLNSQPTVPSPVGPRVSVPNSENLSTSVLSSRMTSPAGVQNIQALLCRPTQAQNIQTSMAMQTPVPSLPVSGNNQQLRPQQPLKGMQDVVSCVGSRSATNLLWNIKPATTPVVYLTSPQTLSGVRARNLIPQSEGHGALPFAAGVAKVQSVGIPKTSTLSSSSSSVLTLGKVTLVSQAAPLSSSHAVTMTGQRPILPREQRMPSLFSSAPPNALQHPVTTVVGSITGSIPPVHVRSMPVQLSGLDVTSPLNTRQPPITAIVTQAPVMQTPVMQALVTQASVSQPPAMQAAQLTAVSTTVLTPVSAKQAVKRFVRERTKSAELKRTSSLGNLLSNETVTSTTTVAEVPQLSVIPVSSTQAVQSLDQSEKQSTSNQTEFNLHQAASALLSISSQDGLDAADATQPGSGEGEDSLDEHDDEVVFTSKGVFRVGDVDVDPKYNRIGREGYACGKCGKIFTSLSYLARHIKRVCPDMSCRKWKCTMCDKAFRHPFGLQQHIYTHTGERPHKCSQCPKAFYSSNDLRRHSRIHSGERPYHCKHCDKSFATTISLKTHTYIHTGEKPHKCPHCPKTFATSSKLGRHIVTHSEQRPFACDHCPKTFNRSGDLRRHNMHVHSNESLDKPFDFDECGTPLNSTSNVSIPRDTHEDQNSVPGQIHQCSMCGEKCSSSNDLGHHMLCHDTQVSPDHVAPVANVRPKPSNQEMDHLDESTESGGVDCS